MVAALANGCPEIIPVETPHEAREVADKRRCLLGGEREGLRIEGFDFGNSPLEYMPERIDNRPIAFTTTNGTRAIRACVDSEALVVASFVNAGSIIRLLDNRDGDTFIVCAGTRGEPSIEDTVCGGMLLEGMRAHGTPEIDEATALWKKHKDGLAEMMREVSTHGRSLVRLGFGQDIDFAAHVDAYDIIPIRENDSIVRKRL
jgi:2-phosphosulfolactate phosphatase